jgi:hypothetical protein
MANVYGDLPSFHRRHNSQSADIDLMKGEGSEVEVDDAEDCLAVSRSCFLDPLNSGRAYFFLENR